MCSVTSETMATGKRFSWMLTGLHTFCNRWIVEPPIMPTSQLIIKWETVAPVGSLQPSPREVVSCKVSQIIQMLQLLFLHGLLSVYNVFQFHCCQAPVNCFLQMQLQSFYSCSCGQMEAVPLYTLSLSTVFWVETIGTGYWWITMLQQNSYPYETSCLQRGTSFASLHTMMLVLQGHISALPPLLSQEVRHHYSYRLWCVFRLFSNSVT